MAVWCGGCKVGSSLGSGWFAIRIAIAHIHPNRSIRVGRWVGNWMANTAFLPPKDGPSAQTPSRGWEELLCHSSPDDRTESRTANGFDAIRREQASCRGGQVPRGSPLNARQNVLASGGRFAALEAVQGVSTVRANGQGRHSIGIHSSRGFVILMVYPSQPSRTAGPTLAVLVGRILNHGPARRNLE